MNNTNRGKPIPATTVRQIQQLRQITSSVSQTARLTGTSRPTVYKYTRKPD